MTLSFVGRCAASMIMVTTFPLVAQQRVATEPLPAAVSARMAQTLFARPVTVTLDRVSLRQAIDAVAASAGVSVSYYSDVLDRGYPRVTLHATRMTLSDALSHVLTGTMLAPMPVSEKRVLIADVGTTPGATRQGTIAGRVTDAKTRQPLAGVKVGIDGTDAVVETGGDGRYHLSAVSAGAHTVTFKQIGYAKALRPVTVRDSEMLTLDVALDAAATMLGQVVVTGTIIPTELKAVPNAMTVITAKQIEERGITKIDQLFRGDVPGLFALNVGSNASLDEVTMFSRGGTALSVNSAGTTNTAGAATNTNPIKTYVDGVELADARYLSQIDPSSIERIEILTGPQASTIYGSNALNGVMQIFTKRGTSAKPQITLNVVSGVAQSNFNSALAPSHTADAQLAGVEGRWAYTVGGSADYVGAWTPGKNTIRYGGSGGGRMTLGSVNVDANARNGVTKNRQAGRTNQFFVNAEEIGLTQPTGIFGRIAPSTSTLNGQTTGLTIGYTPATWWSHELVMGHDVADVESVNQAPQFGSGGGDTLVSYSTSTTAKTSERYATTLRLSLLPRTQATVILGADHWYGTSSRVTAQSLSLTGTLGTPSITRDKPAKNAGGFLQGQLAIGDALFMTYGLRAEWNPNYGEAAQPNLAPRYGMAYAHDIGVLTAKIRASYGRSTRPPSPDLKLATPQTSATLIAQYGPYDVQIANLDLGPEFQQGGEGGVELYVGNRGSLIVTRYNQTVDGLIGTAARLDSVRSILPNPTRFRSLDAAGYGYLYQNENLNVGSIRNQGWELQANATLGPFMTNGTYSWTKSRVIGVTAKYRALFSSDVGYQVGRAVSFLPEHTWAWTFTYARAMTTASITLNGNGQLYNSQDYLRYNTNNNGWRNPNYRLRFDLPSGYRPLARGYTLAHLNAAHRFSAVAEGVLQVQNLMNYYQNDFDVAYATIGRQTKLGVRIRWQ